MFIFNVGGNNIENNAGQILADNLKYNINLEILNLGNNAILIYHREMQYRSNCSNSTRRKFYISPQFAEPQFKYQYPSA